MYFNFRIYMQVTKITLLEVKDHDTLSIDIKRGRGNMAVYALEEAHHISFNSVDLIVWTFLHIFCFLPENLVQDAEDCTLSHSLHSSALSKVLSAFSPLTQLTAAIILAAKPWTALVGVEGIVKSLSLLGADGTQYYSGLCLACWGGKVLGKTCWQSANLT